jgi:hypothetical protein
MMEAVCPSHHNKRLHQPKQLKSKEDQFSTRNKPGKKKTQRTKLLQKRS